MKKYNFTILVILFILILITISVSSYFFYLDIIYKDKLIKKDVASLSELKNMASKPIIVDASSEDLEKKMFEYNDVIRELNLDAIAEISKDIITIRGVIGDGYSYTLFKKLLNLIKNDEVNLISVCVGQECTEDDYGFIIKFKPYLLKLN